MKNINLLTILNSNQNKKIFNTYIFSYLIVLIAYGSKLFSVSYPSDDYFRFQTTEGFLVQADRGRWFTSILNHFIFSEELFVLPYFNTILALFFISLSGLVISKIWDVKNHLIIGFIILIITISPFWAKNLFYNSNVTVSIGAFISSLGLWFLIKKGKLIWGIILLIFSFGVYQTISQSALLITLGSFVIKLSEIKTSKELKKTILHYFLLCIYVVLSFVISQVISEVLMKIGSLDTLYNPYKTATRELSLSKIIDKTIYLFTSPSGFLGNFVVGNLYFGLVTLSLFILGFSTCLLKISKRNKSLRKKLFFVVIVAFFTMLVVIQLPRLLTVLMPIRSCFHFSVLLALMFLLAINNNKILVVNASILFICIYILLSIKYIAVFYDFASRQTQSDIRIANQVVNKIYLHPDFNATNGTLQPFLIIGNKKFSVGNKTPISGRIDNNFGVTQKMEPFLEIEFQAFNKDWSKYKVFEHFTDFKFTKIDYEREKIILNNLVQTGIKAEYPEKKSILFIDGVAVLILSLD